MTNEKKRRTTERCAMTTERSLDVSSLCASGGLGGRRWGCGEHGGSWGSSAFGGLRGFALWWDEFDSRAGSVVVGEDLVGYATDVGFADGVDFLELIEELAPV